MSTCLLLPVSVRAAELQPFFTAKTSSVNTLISIAEKIGTMAGVVGTDEFQEVINMLKNIRGANLNGIIGIAAAVNDAGAISPVVLLPIADLWRAEVPGHPEIFDQLRPHLVRRGEGNYAINSPFGSYIAVQNQGYLIITAEESAEQVPSDPTKLFADLEKYTLGIKFDLDKVEFETLEGNLFGPMLLLAMMGDPDTAEQLENVVEVMRGFYKECAAVAFGIVINPQTADIEVSGTMIARKGSDFAKLFAGYKQQPTIFSGFRGTPENTVFSIGDSATQPQIENNTMVETSIQQWKTILDGVVEQIETEDETGERTKLAKTYAELILEILVAESKRGTSDAVVSMNTDGTLLLAFDTVSLAKIQKLAGHLTVFAEENLPEEAKGLMADNLNLGYTTIEGFRVSSIKIPVIASLELFFGPAPDDSMNDLTLGVFWATKEGDKQAIAVAAGLDFAKTEQTFKAALAQTRTAVPVQKPIGIYSMAGLGKLLQQTVYPIVEKATAQAVEDDLVDLATFRKVIEIFTSAGSDATVTLDSDVKPDRMDTGYRISGKVIQAIISAVRLVAEEENLVPLRPIIQDF